MEICIITMGWGEHDDAQEHVVGAFSDEDTAWEVVQSIKDEIVRQAELPCPPMCDPDDGPDTEALDEVAYEKAYAEWHNWKRANYFKCGGVSYEVKKLEVDTFDDVVAESAATILGSY